MKHSSPDRAGRELGRFQSFQPVFHAIIESVLYEAEAQKDIDVEQVRHGNSFISFATISLAIMGASGSLMMTGNSDQNDRPTTLQSPFPSGSIQRLPSGCSRPRWSRMRATTVSTTSRTVCGR
jgi:hypothetical protein